MTDPFDESGFDFASPRWREGEDTQRSVERDRRLWDRRPPGQHGAIDAGGSVPGQQDEPMGAEDDPADEVRAAGADDDSPDGPPSPPFRADHQAR